MDDQPQTPAQPVSAQPRQPADTRPIEAESGPDVAQQSPQAERPQGRHRLVAALAATALITGIGGVGAGYAVGHRIDGGASSTTASSGTQQATAGTNDDGSGIQSIPGYGWSGNGQRSDPYGGSPYGSGQTQTSDTVKATGAQLTGLVRIVTTMKYESAKAAGTGMVLTPGGEVVTNHHVVAGATSIKVKVMTTGKTYVAKVVGTDTKDDVAVLQLTGASGLKTVETDTDGVTKGEKVTAVGDANGTVGYLSAATGEVLAQRQAITTRDEGSAGGERLTGLIEISSDVISGDSGGATYDADGEVVGMTTAASSGGDIVGYAVPISKVLSIADDLDSGVAGARYDYGYPAFLGIALGRTGTMVQGVYPGTPAAEAGVTAGDTITRIGSTNVTTATALHDAVSRRSPGDSVTVTWTDTSGAAHTETVTLGGGPVE